MGLSDMILDVLAGFVPSQWRRGKGKTPKEPSSARRSRRRLEKARLDNKPAK